MRDEEPTAGSGDPGPSVRGEPTAVAPGIQAPSLCPVTTVATYEDLGEGRSECCGWEKEREA